MSYNKKPQYLREFVQSIQREVLYHAPIFVMKVDLKPSKAKVKRGGGAQQQNSKSPPQLTYSKELFDNITRFSAKDFNSRSSVSVALRNIINETPISKKLTSIREDISERCKTILGAYGDIETTVAYPSNAYESFKNNKKNILLIDFDAQSAEESEIAAQLKQLYFGMQNAAGYSMDDIIQQAKKEGYNLLGMTQFTFNSGIVKSNGLLFQAA